MQRGGQRDVIRNDAVDAHADGHVRLERLDMDIARVDAVPAHEQGIEHLHDGRFVAGILDLEHGRVDHRFLRRGVCVPRGVLGVDLRIVQVDRV